MNTPTPTDPGPPLTAADLITLLQALPPDTVVVGDISRGSGELSALTAAGVQLVDAYRSGTDRHTFYRKVECPSDWKDRRTKVLRLRHSFSLRPRRTY